MIIDKLNTVEGLIFLSFYTKYNINKIHTFLNQCNTVEDIIGHEARSMQKDNSEKLSDVYDNINKCVSSTELCIGKSRFFNIKILTIFDKEYPDSFKNLEDPPPVIYYRGNIHNIDLGAVIGTRNPNEYSKKITKRISERLISKGFGIVSGLAEGIDTEAHKGALYFGGYTMAIVANSLDKIYPDTNYTLASEIIESGGCILTEFPIGINKGKYSFILRNRLVSAISNCVIPIEMSIKSGTMHTINFAIEQNKEIIMLKPPEKILEKDFTSFSGVMNIIDKINIKNISSGIVVEDENGLYEAIESTKLYNDRKFQNKILTVFEKIDK